MCVGVGLGVGLDFGLGVGVCGCGCARSTKECVLLRNVTRIMFQSILISVPEIPGTDLSRDTNDPAVWPELLFKIF